MFSFHKPRVYRSTEGCCICRAKSSSSRFTDSRKYENDSMKCFDLKYPRHGEICNACVLLVKRFKRLPLGSTRHWGHVVDARAGPGTKSMSKHKRNRDDESSNQNDANHGTSSSNSGNANGAHIARRTQNSKSLIPEKFSKIFKKSKKSKASNLNGNSPSTNGKRELKRRSNGSVADRSWEQRSLPTTPDSLDSDYEDSGRNSLLSANGAIVQFQTQTRASSYRSRNNIGATATVVSGDDARSFGTQRKRPSFVGSKRRKLQMPRKHRRTLTDEQKVQFFDNCEWQERKSCCGMVYECAALGGALMLDLEHYRPCDEHQSPRAQTPTQLPVQSEQKTQNFSILPSAVSYEQPPPTTPTNAVVPLPATNVSTNPTPALKKHHLFFKRQSESFPHGDINNTNNTQTKAESMSTTINNTISATCSKSSKGSINASAEADNQHDNTSAINNSATCLLSRHSSAKLTTISPPIKISSSNNSNSNGGSCNKLMHKIKTGKIFKQSLEKISAGVVERVKSGNETVELKNVVRAVPKSYVLTKPGNVAAVNGNNKGNANGLINGSSLPTLHGVPGGNNICTASSSTPKFSDNSSDSGFDENLQDRKSASPLQEDTERKLATRNPMGNVHTMFLANGIQIHGQQQNLLLTGSEVAAKMLQSRNQSIAIASHNIKSNNMQHNTTIQQHYQSQPKNNRLNVSSAGMKIVGNVNNPSSATTTVTLTNAGLLGSHTKPSSTTTVATAARPIYNSNTIQHENGVTTIVPASSLAASTQTAAMNALAPSTVTITPAPTHLGKKLTTAGGNLIANNISSNQSNLLQGVVGSHHLHNAPALNQKIILVKTTPSATKYSNNNLSTNVKTSVAGVTVAGVGGGINAAVTSVTLGACKN